MNRKQFAKLAGRSERQIGRLIKEGLPCHRSGKKGEAIEIDETVAMAWLREREPAESELTKAKEALMRIKADRVELDNAIRAGQLVPRQHYEDTVDKIFQTMVQMTNAMVNRLASQIAALHGNAPAIEQLLKDACDEISVAVIGIAESSIEDFPDAKSEFDKIRERFGIRVN